MINNKKGMTLIECVISVALLSIIVLSAVFVMGGMFQLNLKAGKYTKEVDSSESSLIKGVAEDPKVTLKPETSKSVTITFDNGQKIEGEGTISSAETEDSAELKMFNPDVASVTNR